MKRSSSITIALSLGAVALGTAVYLLFVAPGSAGPDHGPDQDPRPASADSTRRGGEPKADRGAFFQARQRYHLTARADEKAFGALGLAEPMRLEVRKINQQHQPEPRVLVPLSSQDGAEILASDERARRSAINALLGSSAAGKFFAAEASARRELIAGLPESLRSRLMAEEDGVSTPAIGPALDASTLRSGASADTPRWP